MRKLATSTLPILVALAAVALILQGGGGKQDGTSYTVELRNAFDLTEGGDFKIARRAGRARSRRSGSTAIT